MTITITTEDALESLGLFQPPPVYKGPPAGGYAVIGSLCLDNPLSRAIASRLTGKPVVSICDDMIAVKHLGESYRIPLPPQYQRFDRLFCESIYESRKRSKKARLNTETLRSEMLSLLPITVVV